MIKYDNYPFRIFRHDIMLKALKNIDFYSNLYDLILTFEKETGERKYISEIYLSQLHRSRLQKDFDTDFNSKENINDQEDAEEENNSIYIYSDELNKIIKIALMEEKIKLNEQQPNQAKTKILTRNQCEINSKTL